MYIFLGGIVMRKYVLILLCLLFSGCVSFELGKEFPDVEEPVTIEKKEVVIPEIKKEVKPVRKPLTNIGKVYVGMKKEEVMAIMGKHIIIGYEKIKGGNTFAPIFVRSPYRAEILTDAKAVFEVMYYFTDVKKADDIVSDEELTPLVFEKNKLIGKGQDFLFKLKNTLK